MSGQSVFRVDGSDKIAALNGNKQIPNVGRCKTGIDDDGDEVEVLCIGSGRIPSCASALLENSSNGRQNPQYNVCLPDYSPYTRPFMRFPMYPFGLDLSFRDPQGLANYPVDSSQLANAQVALTTYKPVAHFTRHLIISQIRPEDWEAELSAAATSTAPRK
jgi:hypothetical protein